MAPEQGHDAKAKAESTQKTASVEASVPNNDNRQDTLQTESVGWIYLLKKEQLVEQCRNVGIATAGFTVEFLRKKLAETLRTKHLRTSAENLLREVEKEVRLSESTVVYDESISVPPPKSTTRTAIPDVDIMSTVQKWNLRFSGDSDLMEFLERVEELAECYNVHRDNLLPAMLGVLSGNALKWYRVKRSNIRSWAEFRTEIQKFFLPKRFLSQIEQNFYNRRQNNRERAKEFILSMLTLARQHPDLRDRDHLDRIYDGLRTEYRHYVRRGDFSTLDELVALTEEFEALKREERPQPTHILASAKYARERVCWRCKEEGHFRSACTNDRRLFCSYCGRDGSFSRDCDCRKIVNDSSAEGDTRYHITVTIHGLEVSALIDTGATKTYINNKIAEHLSTSRVPSINSKETLQMADRSLTSSLKIFSVRITYERRSITLPVAEIPTLAEDTILGMDFLSAFGIELRLNGKVLPPAKSNGLAVPLHSLTGREFLTSEENDRLRTLPEKCQARFSACSGQCTVTEHVIRLKHDRPIKQRYIPRNPAMMEIINAEVDKLISEEKIEPSCSPYRSPIVLARKKQGGWRMCIDYRQLNAASEPDAYQPPAEARAKAKPDYPPPLAYLRQVAPNNSSPAPVQPLPAQPLPIVSTVLSPSSSATAEAQAPSTTRTTTSAASTSRPRQTPDLLKGITVARPNKPGRHHQYVIKRRTLPPVKVTVLNQTHARIRCRGQEKVVVMIERK